MIRARAAHPRTPGLQSAVLDPWPLCGALACATLRSQIA